MYTKSILTFVFGFGAAAGFLPSTHSKPFHALPFGGRPRGLVIPDFFGAWEACRGQ
jgi:hypothetical protein